MRKATTMMGNKATGGPFSPLVSVTKVCIGMISPRLIADLAFKNLTTSSGHADRDHGM
jgi:hypothetical protein